MRNAIETILKPEVQELFDSFSACFDARIAYYTSDGVQMNVGLNRGASRFCDFIARQLKCRDICLDHDKLRCREAFERRTLHVYTCHAGATEAIYPIIVDDTAIGYIMIGQIRARKSPSASLLEAWGSVPGVNNELSGAFLELPYFTDQQLKHMLILFSSMVRYIVVENLVTLRGNIAIEKALEYMRGNVHNRINLKDVAKLVHKSPSTLSHMFTSVTGRSFKETLIRMKLDRADQIFSSQPQITVAEVADMLSYQDPFYFSRIYKKYRGHPPSKTLAARKYPGNRHP